MLGDACLIDMCTKATPCRSPCHIVVVQAAQGVYARSLIGLLPLPFLQLSIDVRGYDIYDGWAVYWVGRPPAPACRQQSITPKIVGMCCRNGGGGGGSGVWMGMRVEMAHPGKLTERPRTMWVSIVQVRTYRRDGTNTAMTFLHEDRVVDDTYHTSKSRPSRHSSTFM